jgi:hypothetical protein
MSLATLSKRILFAPIYVGQEYEGNFLDIASQQCLTQQHEERIVAEGTVLTVILYC